jgi:hypothetical protein
VPPLLALAGEEGVEARTCKLCHVPLARVRRDERVQIASEFGCRLIALLAVAR